MPLIIQMLKGYSSVVSEEDSDLAALPWSLDIYPTRRVVYAWRYFGPRKTRKRFSMHRMILARMLGRDLLRKEDVDHIDGNGLNNVRENLRLASRALNKGNVPKYRGKVSSEFKGVSWSKSAERWCVFSSIDGKTVYFGSSKDEKEAARLYDRVARERFGEFALTNFNLDGSRRTESMVTDGA